MNNKHKKNPTESQAISETRLINPAEFTKEVVAALQRAMPDLKIQIEGDLELMLHTVDGGGIAANLLALFRAYRTRPLVREDIIGAFVSGQISMLTVNRSERIDPKHILPLLKSNAWLIEANREAELRGATNAQQIQRTFNADLVITYVVDRPEYMTFVDDRHMATLGLDGEGLHKLALENLRQQFTGIIMTRKGGVYRVSCDGIYDASLILLDRICDKARSMVSGDLVAAVLAEDRLLVTGSDDAEGIRNLSDWAQEEFTNAVRPLSPKLLVRKEGNFVPFEASPKASSK